MSRGMTQRVEEVVKACLPDIEGHEHMEVKVCLNIAPKSNYVIELFQSDFLKTTHA